MMPDTDCQKTSADFRCLGASSLGSGKQVKEALVPEENTCLKTKETAKKSARIVQISVQSLAEKLKEKAPIVLLDVREKWEYDLCQIPTSRHTPLSIFENYINSLALDQEIVVLCHHGSRSMQICCLLQHLGFDRLQNLEGGIDAWSQEIDPDVPRY